MNARGFSPVVEHGISMYEVLGTIPGNKVKYMPTCTQKKNAITFITLVFFKE